jgi:prevent-host-death family protein
MTAWTLERAKNQLSEVVRRALAHEPQLVTRGRHDAVIAPGNLVDFLRTSPAAAAVADDELAEDAFDRRPEVTRDVEL